MSMVCPSSSSLRRHGSTPPPFDIARVTSSALRKIDEHPAPPPPPPRGLGHLHKHPPPPPLINKLALVLDIARVTTLTFQEGGGGGDRPCHAHYIIYSSTRSIVFRIKTSSGGGGDYTRHPPPPHPTPGSATATGATYLRPIVKLKGIDLLWELRLSVVTVVTVTV